MPRELSSDIRHINIILVSHEICDKSKANGEDCPCISLCKACGWVELYPALNGKAKGIYAAEHKLIWLVL